MRKSSFFRKRNPKARGRMPIYVKRESAPQKPEAPTSTITAPAPVKSEFEKPKAEKSDGVLSMILGENDDLFFGDDDDIVFGRMPVGMDESEFDALPPSEAYMSASVNPDLYSNTWQPGMADVLDADYPVLAGDEDPEEFESPGEEAFPVFKKALKHFKENEGHQRVARVDNEKTYEGFVCERAVKEIERRVNELRSAVEEHAADHHGGHMTELRKWEDIVGAAEAVADLKSASSAKEATEAMPQVSVDLPPFAEGKIKCWRDGEHIVCSVRFGTSNGNVRIATMAARPQVDVDDVERWALRAGVDPVTLLGAAPDLADVACAKRLVKDCSKAALAARDRHDVLGLDNEPVLLANETDEGTAPLAALMYVEQQASLGDPQAKKELTAIQTAATTPLGEKVAKPLLLEASARLAVGQYQKANKSFMQRYADMAMCL